ncbi:MAG: hypothetical protein HRT66_11780 [Flavobacteriaceae bacterium]|nr:hypothetical protein [Flavobacteriaceae bacterium]
MDHIIALLYLAVFTYAIKMSKKQIRESFKVQLLLILAISINLGVLLYENHSNFKIMDTRVLLAIALLVTSVYFVKNKVLVKK